MPLLSIDLSQVIWCLQPIFFITKWDTRYHIFLLLNEQSYYIPLQCSISSIILERCEVEKIITSPWNFAVASAAMFGQI